MAHSSCWRLGQCQPRHRLGSTAVRLLINRIGGMTNQSSVFLPHELIVREST